MIRKLKIKFIATNMILISIVMATCLSCIYLQAMMRLRDECYTAMHDIIDNSNSKYGYFFEPEDIRLSKYSYLSTYIVETDDTAEVCYIEGFGEVDSLTEEQKVYISDLINSVNSKSNNEGIIEKYNMRYYYKKTAIGKRIVFLDKNYEDENLRRLFSNLFISGMIAFAAFFGISALVAGVATKPVANSMKQQKKLISDVSHELKTPISVISTNTDIVISHPDATVADESKWLGYIKDETERMAQLVNMMLYLAKSDEGIKFEMYETNISNTAYEVVLPFESVCFENGKDFHIEIADDVFTKCNEASLKQLILILLDNAVKYSNPSGRILFRLYTDSDKAIISVFNTGEPIPKQDIPYLFDRFYRVDKSRSRDNGGSGLGLSIAKKIIDNNNANISVISNEENGTTFTCTFKLSKKTKAQKEQDFNQFT